VEIGVSAVATGGAAGAPIFDAESDCVIGICHCGPPCQAGWGVPISAIMRSALVAIESASGTIAPCRLSCRGDLDASGDVGFGDLTTVLVLWGPCGPEGPGCTGDVNADGTVGFADLTELLIAWGKCW
jgi:hypothetical protein